MNIYFSGASAPVYQVSYTVKSLRQASSGGDRFNKQTQPLFGVRGLPPGGVPKIVRDKIAEGASDAEVQKAVEKALDVPHNNLPKGVPALIDSVTENTRSKQ